MFERLVDWASFLRFVPALLIFGVAACASRPSSECLLCDRTPPWHDEVESVDPSCSGMTLHPVHSMVCSKVARLRIARTAEVHGLSSNDALALYEGVHQAPLRWTNPEDYCPNTSDAVGSTILEVTVRRSSRCSERQWCYPGDPRGPLYVPVEVELHTQDHRIDERFESWLAAGRRRAFLSDGHGYYGVMDGPRGAKREIKLHLEHDGRNVAIHGYVQGWGPSGNFPTACWWRCEHEQLLERTGGPQRPADVLNALRALRLATSADQRGFPISIQATAAARHVCIVRREEQPRDGAPIAYMLPAHVVLGAAGGATIATKEVEIEVHSVAGCRRCATVTFRGSAPLEHPDLVAQADGNSVIAHVQFELAMNLTAKAKPTARGKLRLSYLDGNDERVETYELESK